MMEVFGTVIFYQSKEGIRTQEPFKSHTCRSHREESKILVLFVLLCSLILYREARRDFWYTCWMPHETAVMGITDWVEGKFWTQRKSVLYRLGFRKTSSLWELLPTMSVVSVRDSFYVEWQPLTSPLTQNLSVNTSERDTQTDKGECKHPLGARRAHVEAESMS